MTLSNPCIRSIGPRNAKIAFVGEAPGENEEALGLPFVGRAGWLFDDMLEQAEINRHEAFITNVFFTRPPQNKLDYFLRPRSDPHALHNLPAVSAGKYLHRDLLPEVQRLYSELESVKPNLIVALGNTASWAILGRSGISKIRGTVVQSRFGKVLPTYHPAAVTRQFELRPIVVADLLKAKHELEFPDIRRPNREIIVEPDLYTISEFYERHATRARILAADIETKNMQITEIGFAVSKSLALVIPFVDERKFERHYWRTPEEEVAAWKWTQRFLALPQPKVFQNGMYDIQYLRRYGFRLRNCLHDTMILHHAMHPEMLKGLGFMGSIYTNEPAWKLMRTRGEEVLKREE